MQYVLCQVFVLPCTSENPQPDTDNLNTLRVQPGVSESSRLRKAKSSDEHNISERHS